MMWSVPLQVVGTRYLRDSARRKDERMDGATREPQLASQAAVDRARVHFRAFPPARAVASALSLPAPPAHSSCAAESAPLRSQLPPQQQRMHAALLSAPAEEGRVQMDPPAMAQVTEELAQAMQPQQAQWSVSQLAPQPQPMPLMHPHDTQSVPQQSAHAQPISVLPFLAPMSSFNAAALSMPPPPPVMRQPLSAAATLQPHSAATAKSPRARKPRVSMSPTEGKARKSRAKKKTKAPSQLGDAPLGSSRPLQSVAAAAFPHNAASMVRHQAIVLAGKPINAIAMPAMAVKSEAQPNTAAAPQLTQAASAAAASESAVAAHASYLQPTASASVMASGMAVGSSAAMDTSESAGAASSAGFVPAVKQDPTLSTHGIAMVDASGCPISPYTFNSPRMDRHPFRRSSQPWLQEPSPDPLLGGFFRPTAMPMFAKTVSELYFAEQGGAMPNAGEPRSRRQSLSSQRSATDQEGRHDSDRDDDALAQAIPPPLPLMSGGFNLPAMGGAGKSLLTPSSAGSSVPNTPFALGLTLGARRFDYMPMQEQARTVTQMVPSPRMMQHLRDMEAAAAAAAASAGADRPMMSKLQSAGATVKQERERRGFTSGELEEGEMKLEAEDSEAEREADEAVARERRQRKADRKRKSQKRKPSAPRPDASPSSLRNTAYPNLSRSRRKIQPPALYGDEDSEEEQLRRQRSAAAGAATTSADSTRPNSPDHSDGEESVDVDSHLPKDKQCEQCGKPHTGSYGGGRFCCAHCARHYSIVHRWSSKQAASN